MKIRLYDITVLVLTTLCCMSTTMVAKTRRNTLLAQAQPAPKNTFVKPQRIHVDSLPDVDEPSVNQDDIDESTHKKDLYKAVTRTSNPEEERERENPYSDNLDTSAAGKNPLFLQDMVYPQGALDDDDEKIEVNLENADLQNVLDWISSIFKVTFLSDDILTPAGKYQVAGHALTFKTNTPLSKKKVWDLFLTWLDLTGLAVVPGTHTNFYKIVTTNPSDQTATSHALRSPVPTYLNIDWQKLPDNDTRIRYVYLFENTTIGTVQGIIQAFRSNTGNFQPLEKQNGFILTDKASNVRAVMEIISELDRVTMPEGLAFIQLKHADAEDVKKMYDALTEADKKVSTAERLFGTKKLPTEQYFPTDTRIYAEKRKNALIVMGTKEGIAKVEDFITKYIDTDVKVPYSPLYVYELQYANAKDVAQILTDVTKYGTGSAASTYGGVRDGDKFFKPMTIIAEDSGNRLLITADKEDYIHLRKIIEQIDVKQPQIALEVLLLDVVADNDRQLGTQLRNKHANTIGGDANFQASGFPSANDTLSNIVATTDKGLLTNLVNLAIGQTPGSTLISIGSEATGGVWAIFKALQVFSNATLLAKPFLITTNNYPATIAFGETRYVVSSNVVNTATSQAFQNQEALLKVMITPLINSDGIINLNVYVENTAFNTTDPLDANKTTEKVTTNANVYDGEILALGGLTRNREEEVESRVPVLGSIPLVGWFFKNKIINYRKDNLLIFISAKIIEPQLSGGVGEYTREKSQLGKDLICESEHYANRRDPIHRWFFGDQPQAQIDHIDTFLRRTEDIKHFDVSKSEYYKNYTTPAQAIDQHRHFECDDCDRQQDPARTVAFAKKNSGKRSVTAFMPHDSKRVAV